MDNTLIDRAVIDSEFRAERDLYDRIGGGAGPGGVKAVAPTGSELVQFTIGRRRDRGQHPRARSCRWFAPTATDQFTSAGRPVATISNVMIEYRPAPGRRRPRRSAEGARAQPRY